MHTSRVMTYHIFRIPKWFEVELEAIMSNWKVPTFKEMLSHSLIGLIYLTIYVNLAFRGKIYIFLCGFFPQKLDIPNLSIIISITRAKP